jgi:hypothetical protein
MLVGGRREEETIVGRVANEYGMGRRRILSS